MHAVCYPKKGFKTNIFFYDLITDLLPDKDTFIVKIDIQGFECKVKYIVQLDS
jgi:hypothetical protein